MVTIITNTFYNRYNLELEFSESEERLLETSNVDIHVCTVFNLYKIRLTLDNANKGDIKQIGVQINNVRM